MSGEFLLGFTSDHLTFHIYSSSMDFSLFIRGVRSDILSKTYKNQQIHISSDSKHTFQCTRHYMRAHLCPAVSEIRAGNTLTQYHH